MRSDFIKNDRNESFLSVLQRLLAKASALDVAVSYVQMSGWALIKGLIKKIEPRKIRVLITDQFTITQPGALRQMLKAGIQVRNYAGSRVYHPKVYLVHSPNRHPLAAIVGSANMSESGLMAGVEAGMVMSDLRVLRNMQEWFDELFCDKQQTTIVDDTFLNEYESSWNKTTTNRIKIQRITKKSLPKSSLKAGPTQEDLGVVEDIFSTIRTPICVLGMDHARNNVRNIKRLQDVLFRYPNIGSKARSELRLLGFVKGDQLTTLGQQGRACKTERSLAKVWINSVLNQSKVTLEQINPRIDSFRRAARRFWELQPDVRTFFLTNLQSKKQRKVLQTIELLCNCGNFVRKLSLEDVQSLAFVMHKAARKLPLAIRAEVLSYLQNKGSRSWDVNDRRTLLMAWQSLARR